MHITHTAALRAQRRWLERCAATTCGWLAPITKMRRYLGREGHVRTRSRSSRWGPRVAKANKSQGRCPSAWPISRTCPTRAPAVALLFPLVQEASPETVNTPPPFETGRDAWRSPARVCYRGIARFRAELERRGMW